MTESHPNSGGDSAVSIEKPSPDYPATPGDTSAMSTDQHQSSSDAGQGGEMEKTPTADANKDTTNGKPEGGALNRVESQAQKLGKSKIIVIMSALCLAVFLAALDMTIISTALPTMASYFKATESGYSWMASSYLLANAACIPLWGKISDIWGRKPIILLANFIFLVGSLICALAINLPMILAGRAIQGVGGGGIIVLAQICITDLFSVRERPLYYSFYGITWALAGSLGPIIGGAFTTNVTWRWCFYINLPIGGVSFVILIFFLKIESAKTPLIAGLRSIDWTGTVLTIGGTLMFLFGLEFGGVNYPWASATVICLIVFGIVIWVLAMLNEWKLAKYPIIPVRIFNNLHNAIIIMICFFHGVVFIAGSYFLPLYFQTVLLATPILSGVYVLPQVVSLSITSALTGFLIKKSGRYREFIIFGMVFMTLGFGLLIDLKSYASWPRIIIYQIIGGAGVGPLFQSPMVALQANIHRGDMATATATFGFMRQLSAAISVVLGTVIYQNVLGQRIRSAESVLGPKTASAIANSFSLSSKSLIANLPKNQRNVVLDAFTFTFSHMWIFYVCMSAIGLIFTCFLKPVTLSKEHTIAKTGLAEQERARQEILAAQRKATHPAADEEAGTETR
ncbi:MFS drug transporter [Aspergillus sclerotialis]|uniref:Efflux pump dotC n=1 Tax=Aspergillus sclerotialis TaxID=2070753 RepID=A0A3A2ZMB7_9EURO|nr:MFS drug transporter [Aspergillus sclerotialis]